MAKGLTQNPTYLDLTRRKFRKQIRNVQEQELLVAAAPVYGCLLYTSGLITASAGNHAQGVAYAAKAFGAKAVIVMPTTCLLYTSLFW